MGFYTSEDKLGRHLVVLNDFWSQLQIFFYICQAQYIPFWLPKTLIRFLLVGSQTKFQGQILVILIGH